MRKQLNTKQPRNRHPSIPGRGAPEAAQRRASAHRRTRRRKCTRRASPGLRHAETNIKITKEKNIDRYVVVFASRRVASSGSVCWMVGWMCRHAHAQLDDDAADVFVCLVDPTHGIFDGLRTVDSCTKTECIEGRRPSIHPSFHPSVVSSNACAQKRASAPRVGPSARTRASMDRSIYFRCIGFRRRRSRASVASVASDA